MGAERLQNSYNDLERGGGEDPRGKGSQGSKGMPWRRCKLIDGEQDADRRHRLCERGVCECVGGVWVPE